MLHRLLVMLLVTGSCLNHHSDGYTGNEAITTTEETTTVLVHHQRGRFGKEYSGLIVAGYQRTWAFDTGRVGDGEMGRMWSLVVDVGVGEEVGVRDPVVVQVRFGGERMELQVPMEGEGTSVWRQVQRTLCSPILDPGRVETNGTLSGRGPVQVVVSTTSPIESTFHLSLHLENNLLDFDQVKQTQVESGSPALVHLPSGVDVDSRYVVLFVNSEDDGCLTVSVQKERCPVLDHETSIEFRGNHHTMSKTAAIPIKTSDLQSGVHILLLLHADDSECDSSHQKEKDHVLPDLSKTALGKHETDKLTTPKRLKSVELLLQISVDDSVYLYATAGVLLGLIAFCVVFGVLFWKYFRTSSSAQLILLSNAGSGSSTLNSTTDSDPNQPTTTTSTSATHDNEPPGDHLCCFVFRVPHTQPYLSPPDQSSQLTSPVLTTPPTTTTTTSAIASMITTSIPPVLAPASSTCKKCTMHISKSANRYAGTVLVVAAFYTLPVLQFVLLYQRVLQNTGNEDLCYHNFLCNHGLWGIAAFNHIFSNVGYVVFGLFFMGLVWAEQRVHENECLECGIHPHFGMYYAMGCALVMQGVLSGLYHVCPTHLSYQFDTFFMYVTAALCLLKIYQARHPDSNASAVMAFTSLALILVFVLTTIIFQAWYFWLMITCLHVGLVFMLSVHIYSFGQWELDPSPHSLSTYVGSLTYPLTSQTCMVLILTLANLINWALAISGIIFFYKYGDVSSHFLLIFLANLGLYFSIYIILKIKNGERILWPTRVYLSIGVPVWLFGLVTFLNWPANWELSTAESRRLNVECSLLGFYDVHDVWHFLSSIGMFFLFMFFFTIDDDLKLVKRSNIKVF